METLEMVNKREKVSAIGKPYIVKKCARCRQKILVDPAHPEDDLCESCNPKTAREYWTAKQLRNDKNQRSFNF
jgi:hypothetical protein